MKFPSYGLIISLSVFLFSASFAYTEDETQGDTNATTTVETTFPSTTPIDTTIPATTSTIDSTFPTSTPIDTTIPSAAPVETAIPMPSVETPAPSAEATNESIFTSPQDTKNNEKDIKKLKKDTEKALEELRKTLKETAQYLSKQIDTNYNKLSVSTASASNQLKDLKQQQNTMLIMLDSIKQQFNTFNSSSSMMAASMENAMPFPSTYEAPSSSNDGRVSELKKEMEDLMSMLVKLNENQEALRDKVAVLSSSPQKTPDVVPNTGVVITTTTKNAGLVPSQATLEKRSGQQYVKLKMMQDGQEVELFLDPSYVDMDIALPKGKGKGGPKNENVDKIMDYLSQMADKTKPNTPQPQQQQQPSEQPQQPLAPSRPNTGVDNPAIQDSQTLDDLLKAQKLFYERKYNAALNSVQSSLAKQETALAYAIEGSIYFTMGDVDLATASWESALRLNPNMIEVKKALFKYKR